MIEYKVIPGIDRFYNRYPDYPRVEKQEEFEYLGVGAMMVSPKRDTREITKELHDKLFLEDMRDY